MFRCQDKRNMDVVKGIKGCSKSFVISFTQADDYGFLPMLYLIVLSFFSQIKCWFSGLKFTKCLFRIGNRKDPD